MADLTTTQDLKTKVLDQAGERTDGTSDWDTATLDYMNRVYSQLQAGGNQFGIDFGDTFSWARSSTPIAFNLQPKYATGTLSATKGSTAITLSDAPSYSLVDWYLKVDDRRGIYRVAAHTASSTSVTLDAPYDEDTGSTLSFRIFKLDYRLKDVSSIEVRRLAEPARVYRTHPPHDFNENDGLIEGIDPKSMTINYPLRYIREEIPSKYSIVTEKDGDLTLKFNAYPETETRVEFEYIPMHSPLRNQTFTDSDVSTGDEQITLTAHGLKSDDIVQLTNSSGALPTGLSADTSYYVEVVDADTIKLRTDELRYTTAAIDITAASGGGTHRLSSVPILPDEYKSVLTDLATYFILLEKSDNKAATYLQLGQSHLEAIQKGYRREQSNIEAGSRGRLLARLDQTGRRYRRRFKTEYDDN